MREILAGPHPQKAENLSRRFLVAEFRLAAQHVRLTRDELAHFGRQLSEREHEISAGGNRATRHGAILGLIRVLNEDEATLLPYRAHADGPVRSAPAQHDGKAITVLVGE